MPFFPGRSLIYIIAKVHGKNVVIMADANLSRYHDKRLASTWTTLLDATKSLSLDL